MKKLFILSSSLPPRGSVHTLMQWLLCCGRLSTKCSLLCLQLATEPAPWLAAHHHCFLSVLTDFSRLTWAYIIDFFPGLVTADRITWCAHVFAPWALFCSQIPAVTLRASRWIPVRTACGDLGLFRLQQLAKCWPCLLSSVGRGSSPGAWPWVALHLNARSCLRDESWGAWWFS